MLIKISDIYSKFEKNEPWLAHPFDFSYPWEPAVGVKIPSRGHFRFPNLF